MNPRSIINLPRFFSYVSNTSCSEITLVCRYAGQRLQVPGITEPFSRAVNLHGFGHAVVNVVSVGLPLCRYWLYHCFDSPWVSIEDSAHFFLVLFLSLHYITLWGQWRRSFSLRMETIKCSQDWVLHLSGMTKGTGKSIVDHWTSTCDLQATSNVPESQ